MIEYTQQSKIWIIANDVHGSVDEGSCPLMSRFYNAASVAEKSEKI
jgi:hypothetical protein